jgi:hypothetical protein
MAEMLLEFLTFWEMRWQAIRGDGAENPCRSTNKPHTDGGPFIWPS